MKTQTETSSSLGKRVIKGTIISIIVFALPLELAGQGTAVGKELWVGSFRGALHKKSWAVIDRPYSLGCATVGALYERPRCIFCAKPFRGDRIARFPVAR